MEVIYMNGRKLVSPRQLKFARAIANALNIEVAFSENDSYYDVSEFIREHEDEYKKCNWKKSSLRQIDYANAISRACYGYKRFDESSRYGDVSDFISKNKDAYARILWRESIIEKNNEDVVECSKDFPTESMLFLCDNLYKVPGVYAFIGENNTILYIGKSVDLSQRITSSYRERKNSAKIERVMFYAVNNIADTNILEILLITENNPVLNEDCKTEDSPELFHSGIDILRDFSEISLNNSEREAV